MKQFFCFLLIPLFAFITSSCHHPASGAGSTPAPTGLHVPNKFQGYTNAANGQPVSFKVKIKVETLDGGGNAVQFSNTNTTIPSSGNNVATLVISGVTIPTAGDYVVQVWETALDCHHQDSQCGATASKNSYFIQQTFHTTLNSITFTNPFSLDDWDCC